MNKYFLVSAFALAPQQFATIFMDISDRKRGEAERERFYNMLNASVNEIYIFDAGTLRFQFVSEGARRNLGYTMDTLRNMTPLDLKPEMNAEGLAKLLAPLRTGERERVDFQTLHQRADGSRYPVEVHLQLREDRSQKVFLAVVLDITERQRAEKDAAKRTHELEVFYKASVGREEMILELKNRVRRLEEELKKK